MIGLVLIMTSFLAHGQSRSQMTETIIWKLNILDTYKMNYEFQVEALKYQATGSDSLKLVELERKLSDDEISKRIHSAFEELFSDEEIVELHALMKTGAFEKLFSGKFHDVTTSQFNDIEHEIERISQSFSGKIDNRVKFEPIPVDRTDGFYATVDYASSAKDQDIKLERNPAITSKDISEVKKGSSVVDNRPEIHILLTSEGARKFQKLTYDNVGKPIAIVIDGTIVSLPVVQAEIIGGKVSLTLDSSEEEVDSMIKRLKGI